MGANNNYGVQGYAPVRRRGRSNAMGTSSGYARSPLYTEQDEDDLESQPGDTPYQAAATEAYNAGSPGAVGTVTEEYNADSPGAVGEVTEPYRMPGGQPVEDQPRQTTLPGRSPGHMLPDGTITGDDQPRLTTLPGRSPGHMLPDGTIEYDEEPIRTTRPYRPRGGMMLPDGTMIGDEEKGPGHFEQYEAGAASNWQEAGNENALYSMRDTEAEGDPNEFLSTDDATAAYEADPPPVAGQGNESAADQELNDRRQDLSAIDALIGEIEGISSRHNENAPPIERDKQVRDPDSYLDGPGNSAGYQDALDGGDATANTVERGRQIISERDQRMRPGGQQAMDRFGAIELPPEEGSMGRTGSGEEMPVGGSFINPDWTPWNGESKYITWHKNPNARTPEQIREDQRKDTTDRQGNVVEGTDSVTKSVNDRVYFVNPETGETQEGDLNEDIPFGFTERVIVPRGVGWASHEGALEQSKRKQAARDRRGSKAQDKKDRIAKFREDKKNAGPTGQQFRNAYNNITRRSNAGLISPQQANTELNYLASLQGFGRGGAAAGAPGTGTTPGTPGAGTPATGTPATGTPATARTQSTTENGRPDLDQDGNATAAYSDRTKNWINDPTVQSRWQGVYGGAEGAMDSFNNPNSGVSDLIGSGEGRTSLANYIEAQPRGQQNQLYEDMFDRIQAAHYSKGNDDTLLGWGDSDRTNDLQALHHEDLINDIQSVFNGQKHSPQQKREAVKKWLAYGNQVQRHPNRNRAAGGTGVGGGGAQGG